MLTTLSPSLNETLTHQYVQRLQQLETQGGSDFSTARHIARNLLGSRKIGENQALFGFWIPGLQQAPLNSQHPNFRLELFMPAQPLNLEQWPKGSCAERSFTKISLPMQACGDYLLAAVDHLPIGSPQQEGAFYWVQYTPPNGTPLILRDPLAQSLPFGVYAPAEVYDMAALLKNRTDLEYFKTHYRDCYEDGTMRAKDIGITLEIHPETATQEGTLAALTEHYQALAEKIRNNLAQGNDPYAGFTAAEQNWVAFDTVELTPEVPPVERESESSPSGEFFKITAPGENTITVTLKKPDISNWGYDTPIIGTGAVNPSILRSGRPHEFLALVETLHNMPHRPIQISLDAVLGHADFQGAKLLETPEQPAVLPNQLKYVHSAYFRGANMYGRDLNYGHAVVRAILLEMYRRKINFGFDCVRVDGGQDFVKTIDPVTDFRVQDDDFIREMVTQKQEITDAEGNSLTRRLDMNVEDGRPWPNDMNWLYNATYTEHILKHALPDNDRVKQWGSLIFAHNVHGKFKWFQNKWDRFKDTFKDGQDWITGHSNHDNARYYYRLVSPKPGRLFQSGHHFDDFYNDQLGPDLPAAAHTALDNPALSALVLGFLPGSPMFFVNALFRTPWLFFRNTDDRYGVKVVADEGSRFLTWYVNEDLYNQPESFKPLKALGFQRLSQLIQLLGQDHAKPAFMDVLFNLHETIKTDPTMVLYLFDDPAELGGFVDVEALKNHAHALRHPASAEAKAWVETLQGALAQDPIEADRKLSFTAKFITRTLAHQTEAPESLITQKLLYLQSLYEQNQTDLLALLLEDAAQRNGYDISAWGQHPELVAVTPAELLTNGVIPPPTLKAFAMAFMEGAKELCLLSRYSDQQDSAQTAFNLALRRFRQENTWLAKNPVNDLTLDFFNRKILPNGAKNTGAFFSDQGDVVNANTLYYGWRTSPDQSKQVFLLANMEGKPLARLALADFLPNTETWQVIASSPGLGELPESINHEFVLENVRNGQAILLERSLNPAP
ncbi:glucosylglycerol hydrolase [Vampirovibrio sp.]|uniref:glucosylglycerol hydrolase n=1 Tax=Vampirovibrio sp. TaxID=2717857 RepID=UPI0035939C65